MTCGLPMERCGEALRDYAQKSSNPSGLTPQKVEMSSLIKKKKILAMKLAKDQPMNPGLTHDLVGGFNQMSIWVITASIDCQSN